MNIINSIKTNQKIIVVLLVLLITIPIAAYALSPEGELQKKVLPAATKSDKKLTEKETKSLTEKVGRLIELPKDELPSIATVKNKFELPPQPFYKNAENGDIVLLFMNSKKAILYRPSKNKIIEVSPINIPSPSVVKSTPAVSVSSDYLTPSPTRTPRYLITPKL